MIRLAKAADAPAIADIYNPYILETTVTFEEVPVIASDIAERMQAVQDHGLPWLVAERDDVVVGYAYASPWRSRAAYRNSVEVSIYLAPTAARSGIGTALYEDLFARLQAKRVHAVIGGVTLPNPASVAFHERMGMRKVAHFEEVGYKFERWLDVGYWQLLFAQ
jgi:phosphinothricin acetyltransferase